jgi:hypothetical protein
VDTSAQPGISCAATASSILVSKSVIVDDVMLLQAKRCHVKLYNGLHIV